MWAIITIGYREYAIPLSKTEKLLNILEDAIEVEGDWADQRRVYHRVKGERGPVAGANIYTGNILSPKKED